jgi:multidrug efflux pump subunit AcrA (membrane-fusion protein)
VTEGIKPGVVACSHHLGRWRRRQDPPANRWATNTVDIRQVQMGPRVDDEWIVASGLAPGERVAVEGLQRMRQGMQVVARDAAAGPPGER